MVTATRRPTDYHLLHQEAGDQLFRMGWPPSREAFFQSFIDPYRGSAIDGYCFDTNICGATMFYDSAVGEMYGKGRSSYRGASGLRQHEIIRHLCAIGEDPPRLAVEGARSIGMDCFLRLRMNDLHDRHHIDCCLDQPTPPPKLHTPEPCYYLSDMKRNRPDLLLGNPWADHTKDSYEYWESMAYNYALPEVRELYFRLAEELVTRCEPDGLELDFLRFPFFFPRSEAYAQRHLLTDLVRRIRTCVNETSQLCGHPIYLMADVPDTIDSALETGMDVPKWLSEGLLDMVTIGRGYTPYSTPWEEVADLAEESGVPALACFNHGKLPGWVPSDGTNQLGRQCLNTAAMRAYQHGVQGLSLFNYFYQTPDYKGTWMGNPIGFDFTHDLVDSGRLAGGTLVWELDKAMPAHVAQAHGRTSWKGVLPAGFGVGETFSGVFDIAHLPGRGGRLELKLMDVQFGDRLSFAWNGHTIIPEAGAWPGPQLFDRWDYSFKIDPAQVLPGANNAEINLQSRDNRLDPYVTLLEARLTSSAGGNNS